MELKRSRLSVFLVLFLLLAWEPPAFCHGLEDLEAGTTGITATVGYSYHADLGSGLTTDFGVSYLFFNAGAAGTWYWNPSTQVTRGFAGIGLGQLIQLQAGFGSGPASFRARSVLDLSHPFAFEGFRRPKSVMPVIAVSVEVGSHVIGAVSVGVGW